MTYELSAMEQADWYYDDGKHVGLDFDSKVQVATYDARQKSTDTAAAGVLAELGVKAGSVLADFGCGTGVLVCQAALAGCRVHAVDISQAMLDATQGRAAVLNAHGIEPQRAGFLSFNLPESSLDFATTQYALHHLNDFWKLVALQRIWRALRPGGTLLLRDVVYSCHPAELKQTVDAWLQWMHEERGYSREENVTHVRDEHSTFAWVLEGLLERAGFSLVSAKYTRGVYATYVAQRPQ